MARVCPEAGCGHGRCNQALLACECNPGWKGATCSEPQCPTNEAGECSGRGICHEGSCFCADGFSGVDCGKMLCPNECSHNGVCNFGACQCFRGFEGHDCSRAGHDRNKKCATVSYTHLTLPTICSV